ncbi:MAG: ligand-binding protein SH3 [Phycisphaerales bacterium]|nr:ligand-binding protein SH3 [Phycisphaerales bacterium]MCB9856467.1 ligand-binding protein SH3 [Phycisphaerales bacterium]MCB9863948.1 ligand-binding protein SH3 [Phycisphaerales bacterium]
MKFWILLLIAAAFEVGWVIGLRSFSMNRPILATAIFASYVLSFVFLEKAVQGIPLGVAYGVWTGVGVVGAFVFAAAFLKERPTTPQILFASLVLVGVIGLYATTRKAPPKAQDAVTLDA